MLHIMHLQLVIAVSILFFLYTIVDAYAYGGKSSVFQLKNSPLLHHQKRFSIKADGKGFGPQRPKVITPTPGNANNDKFMMMYTCKICNGRNSQMVSKVAYAKGMVISRCKHCDNKHLIADNQFKLDMPEFGKTVEEHLLTKGETVQKMTISAESLEDNYLLEKDGKIFLYPKALGQPPADTTVIDIPIPSPKSTQQSSDEDDNEKKQDEPIGFM